MSKTEPLRIGRRFAVVIATLAVCIGAAGCAGSPEVSPSQEAKDCTFLSSSAHAWTNFLTADIDDETKYEMMDALAAQTLEADKSMSDELQQFAVRMQKQALITTESLRNGDRAAAEVAVAKLDDVNRAFVEYCDAYWTE